LQDRLVKELRLAGVNDVDAANAFLPTFMAAHNARFARSPANEKDLTAQGRSDRGLHLAGEAQGHPNPDPALRSHGLYPGSEPLALAAAGKAAEVVEYPDGRIVVRHDGVDLPYRLFDNWILPDQAEQHPVQDNELFAQDLPHGKHRLCDGGEAAEWAA
jgi:hypothetical protein